MPSKNASRSKALERKSVPDEETPRVLNSEEKHQLILAHARMRAPKDSVQRATVWGGVLLTLAVLVGGWWMTVGAQVRRGFEGKNSDFKAMTDQLDKFRESLKGDSVVGQFAVPTPTNAASATTFSEMLKAVLESDASSTYDRNDLLAPAPSISATSSSSDVSAVPVNPDETGLTPDQPLQ